MIASLRPGERFNIDGGDGDQSYFSNTLRLLLVEESWFPAAIPDFGEALLFTVDEGAHRGEYIAVTGRGGDLVRRLVDLGYVTAAVWRVTNPGPTYHRDSLEDLYSIGMSVVLRDANSNPRVSSFLQQY